uniref:Centrosomal protein of 135 kDa n=1 Tax=Cacopsylla melanoneura TaxID=428564 RepID=A0A8D8R2I0_9HEMI
MEHLRAEIRDLEIERNNALCENKRLQNDFYQVSQEAIHSKRVLDATKTELEELKCQVQQYCSELKHLEDMLSRKEAERMDLLKHLKFISQETAALESSNQILDCDLKRCRQQLTEAEKEIMRLEACIQDKECVIKSLEGKLQELSCLTSQLEGQLQCAREEKYHQGEDLTRCQETLQQLIMQKEALRHQLVASENCKNKIEEELNDRKGIIVTLQDQLNKERCHSANLEDILRQTKSEMHEVCLSNQRYQEEIAGLNEKVDYLMRKLQQEQDENETFHRNIEDIRKEITTARYNNHVPSGDHRDRLASTCRHYPLDTNCPPPNVRRDATYGSKTSPTRQGMFPKPGPCPGANQSMNNKSTPLNSSMLHQQTDLLNYRLSSLRNKTKF